MEEFIYNLNDYNCENINNKIKIKKKETIEEYDYDLNYYKFEIIDNIIKIKINENEITKEELLKTDLTYSNILEALYDIEYFPLNYKGILDKLLIKFSAKKLKKISLFNSRIRDGECFQIGYYIETINITYPKLSTNDIKKEILNLIYHLNIDFQIRIKLKNEKIIKFKLNNHK
jgi:hypothetical protein